MKKIILFLILAAGAFGQISGNSKWKNNTDGSISPKNGKSVAIGTTVLGPNGLQASAPCHNSLPGAVCALGPFISLSSATDVVPLVGLVGRYDFTGITGGATSVANQVAGQPALTLVGGPTIAAGGVTFATNQYAVSADVFTTVTMAKDWTIIVAGVFSGTGVPVSLGGNVNATDYQTFKIESAASMYAISHNGATSNMIATPGASFSMTLPNVMLFESSGDTMRIVRMDNGAYSAGANALPTGNPRLGIGVDIRNNPYNIMTSMQVFYALLYQRALTSDEQLQAYAWIKTYLAVKGTFLDLPTRAVTALTLPTNGLALTPPMGWSTWNSLNLAITDAIVRSQADALVSSGMQAAGYQYVLVDDGWSSGRDAHGNLVADAAKFPSGMKAVSDYVHAKGLKFGLYTSPAPKTCGGRTGSYLHEIQDAVTFAAWGVDYVKHDWCGGSYDGRTGGMGPHGLATKIAAYQKMALALRATGRPIVFNAAGHITEGDQITAAGANLWRTGIDVQPAWGGAGGVSTVGFAQTSGAQYAGPGHWNDPDMLQIGNTAYGAGLTDDEGRTQMSLWAILAAPLIAGNNLVASMSAATKATLTNADVIAVDQDALGIQGVKADSVACGSATCEVWVKQLTGTNTCAIGLFNRDSAPHDITAMFATIAGVVSACGAGPYTTTRDLWAHTSLGTLADSYTATAVPAHGVAMIRVAP